MMPLLIVVVHGIGVVGQLLGGGDIDGGAVFALGYGFGLGVGAVPVDAAVAAGAGGGWLWSVGLSHVAFVVLVAAFIVEGAAD